MKSPVKFAIVGCGRIAQRHAEHINNIGKLVAVCDINEKAGRELSIKYNCKFFTKIDEMLSKISGVNVISICTPNGLHAKHSILSLEAGFNVLCEKPMAISSYDCGQMISAAEKSNCRLFIVKQNRFNPPVEAVKKIIDKGILGKIFSVQLNCFWNRNNDYYANSWKGTKNLDGGTLFTQFSHFIDLLYWLIGDVKKVFSILNNFAHKDIIDFEDSGVVALEFNNGALGAINYNVNSFKQNMEGSLTIFAENGTIKIGGQYLNELEYQNIRDYKIENLKTGNKPNNYGSYVGSMSNHDKVYKNVVDVLLHGKSISTNCYEGMKVVEIIEKIYNKDK
jgi:UDP-N-acetyl-2-amino-2-deoxyglucuronate dehydrogenase